MAGSETGDTVLWNEIKWPYVMVIWNMGRPAVQDAAPAAALVGDKDTKTPHSHIIHGYGAIPFFFFNALLSSPFQANGQAQVETGYKTLFSLSTSFSSGNWSSSRSSRGNSRSRSIAWSSLSSTALGLYDSNSGKRRRSCRRGGKLISVHLANGQTIFAYHAETGHNIRRPRPIILHYTIWDNRSISTPNQTYLRRYNLQNWGWRNRVLPMNSLFHVQPSLRIHKQSLLVLVKYTASQYIYNWATGSVVFSLFWHKLGWVYFMKPPLEIITEDVCNLLLSCPVKGWPQHRRPQQDPMTLKASLRKAFPSFSPIFKSKCLLISNKPTSWGCDCG